MGCSLSRALCGLQVCKRNSNCYRAFLLLRKPFQDPTAAATFSGSYCCCNLFRILLLLQTFSGSYCCCNLFMKETSKIKQRALTSLLYAKLSSDASHNQLQHLFRVVAPLLCSTSIPCSTSTLQHQYTLQHEYLAARVPCSTTTLQHQYTLQHEYLATPVYLAA